MASSRSAVMAPGTGSASSASTYHGEADASGWRTPAWRIGELQRQVGDEFEGDDAVAAHLLRERQEIDRGLRAGYGDEGRLVRLRAWGKASARRR